MPSIPERLAKLEERQIAHERANDLALAAIAQKHEMTEEVAMEAHQMVTQTNTLVAQMPDKIIKAIDEKNRTKRMEFKDWILVLAAIAGPVVAVLVAKG